MKTFFLCLALCVGGLTASHAAISSVPVSGSSTGIIQVGERCGEGMWRRGPANACYPFMGPGGTYRGTPLECPPGWHIGPARGACWPNR